MFEAEHIFVFDLKTRTCRILCYVSSLISEPQTGAYAKNFDNQNLDIFRRQIANVVLPFKQVFLRVIFTSVDPTIDAYQFHQIITTMAIDAMCHTPLQNTILYFFMQYVHSLKLILIVNCDRLFF